MNLKYYLRGLGVGIDVTALIMGIALGGKKEKLSDSEIIERARALGMTEEGTLLDDREELLEEAEAAEAGSSGEAEASVAAGSAAATETTSPAPSGEAEASGAAGSAAASVPAESPTPSPEPETSEEGADTLEYVTIRVSSGEGSYRVCEKLEQAGLVASASAFDRYLYENGYDKRINTGTFEIPKGTDPEQIARILAGL